MSKVAKILKKNGLHEVICQCWEESERGWGQRPDGFSLHVSEEKRQQFCKQFWDSQKQMLGEEPPDEYTRESGRPYKVYVTKQLYNRLKNKNGLTFSNPFPEPNELFEEKK